MLKDPKDEWDEWDEWDGWERMGANGTALIRHIGGLGGRIRIKIKIRIRIRKRADFAEKCSLLAAEYLDSSPLEPGFSSDTDAGAVPPN
jgi:hypothetical protein